MLEGGVLNVNPQYSKLQADYVKGAKEKFTFFLTSKDEQTQIDKNTFFWVMHDLFTFTDLVVMETPPKQGFEKITRADLFKIFNYPEQHISTPLIFHPVRLWKAK